MIRIRVTYAKTQPLRYTSNLDLHKIWERTLRRAHLPIAYSQGFHPQPRLTQACPLPLGFTSRSELIDIWLENDPPLEIIQGSLLNSLPPGITLHNIEEVDMRAPSLPTRVNGANYIAEMLDPLDETTIQLRILELLAAVSIPRQRRGKDYDLRPMISALSLNPAKAGHPAFIQMTLAARASATGRPEEVLDALEINPTATRIERIQLVLEAPMASISTGNNHL